MVLDAYGSNELDGYNMKPAWYCHEEAATLPSVCMFAGNYHEILIQTWKLSKILWNLGNHLVVQRILANVIPKNEHLAVVGRSGWPVASTTSNKSGNNLQHAQLFQMLNVGTFRFLPPMTLYNPLLGILSVYYTWLY